MIQKLLITACCLVASATLAAEEISLPSPPASLAQWYQPAAKRHIWLHNMFKLRRELQAVQTYSKAKDQARTKKWADLLVEHYRKIEEMVPEWKDELDLEQAKKLEAAAATGDFEGVDKALNKLGNSCNSCHREFRAVTAAVYRTPDYSKVKVETADGKTLSYLDYMVHLQHLVNEVVIYMKDDNMQAAQASTGRLELALEKLKPSCISCHGKDSAAPDYYLGIQTEQSMQKLNAALKAGNKKDAGRAIGETALNACAHCHGVHRALYDLTELMR